MGVLRFSPARRILLVEGLAMKTIYNVVNEGGMVRKSFTQKFQAEKYAHDLNQWLMDYRRTHPKRARVLAPQTGGKLVWKVEEMEVSEMRFNAVKTRVAVVA